MSDWKTLILKDITSKIGSGATPKGGSNNYKESGISLIRSQNVLDFAFTNDGLAFIDEDQAYDLRNVVVHSQDILFNITGDSVARCCIVPDSLLPARVNQHVAIVRVNELADVNFIFYNLQFLKPELLIAAEIGATRNAITKSMLENLEISLPPLPEQRAIAAILSSLDDKIDLLHRQNATLEKMAETLFRQWFVDEAREKWESVKLKQVVEVGIGRTPPRQQFEWFSNLNIHMKWVSIKDLGDSGIFVFDTSEYLTDEAVEKFSIPVIPENTVLLSFKMTVGRVAITTEPMLSNEAIAHFRFKKDTPFSKEYLYYYLKLYPYDTLGSTSSIVTSINSGMIKEMEITIPDEVTMQRFDYLTSDYFLKIRSNQIQIRTLTALRDSLLPKLMSGEVSVNN